ncbi:hypothetical protein ACH4UA_01630 [Streptomyces sp. NPDC020939]|uniref:hypothetical protein n=1 Tax=unclassified Streptomyces TaxID=2593676 RepID=UPI003796902F
MRPGGQTDVSPSPVPGVGPSASHKWKELHEAADPRDGRLHDARHTAGTVVDAISARMRRRHQHLTDRVLHDTPPRSANSSERARTAAPAD